MIDFLKYRIACAAFSVIMFLSFIGVFIHKKITRGQAFTYSVEFTGGTQMIFKFSKPTASAQILNILNEHGWQGAITREFGAQEILIRIKEFSSDIGGLGEKIRSTLEENLSEKVTLLQIDSVGQATGEELTYNLIKAVVIALIMMLAYIAWRFWSFSFALGADIALFHDIIAILFFFLLFDKEISINVIGAILAILGYSINDTIVIFTQIRDQLKSAKNMSIDKVVNLSLNQTLRRTTLTSLATALIVVSLIVLGGETLRDLSYALLIGIIFGTYSSIYIASPVMLLFYKETK